MRSSIFFATVLLAVASILLSCVNDASRNNVASVTQAQQAGQFLNYVSAFNDLWTANAPADGDAAAKVTLPDWLPRNTSIQLRISGGAGYVFAPSSPGLYAQLMDDTENSSHYGLSDAAGINTPSGRLARPDFIPVGYVVYVR
ncbi:PilM protein [Kosakonia radicincitans]|uniref:PilM protein n=1 Tax=Kosakonia radicincitans TaxID=283686 RepID=A0AAX2EZF8_9ENTR|nr:type IV pilus biogenesis protein PilM [Kosakonia radicincitans]SFF37859.1 PilM protein [Kosakonia radicincitans]SFR26201.1 PilM protein [Kosakonia radicincitans]SFU16689.1 PilM protein [Kosakonia radicincitans]SFY31902.1 PilM protein [Kosakonia radicincitans]